MEVVWHYPVGYLVQRVRVDEDAAEQRALGLQAE
jgi:hypothetical protein